MATPRIRPSAACTTAAIRSQCQRTGTSISPGLPLKPVISSMPRTPEDLLYTLVLQCGNEQVGAIH
jgi:hypothetical protein